MRDVIQAIAPGQFRASRHFYAGARKALPDPRLKTLLGASVAELSTAYCDAFPETDLAYLTSVLDYRPRHYLWGGSDLFLVKDESGRRDIALLEMNSSPSGQKYLPGRLLQQGETGYDILADKLLAPAIKAPQDGVLAVLYDKNGTEASGYAAAIADRLQEPVHKVMLHHPDIDSVLRHTPCGLEIRTAGGWTRVRGAWRYVTDRPWSRLPLRTHTPMVNPIIACIAGGRNKAAAAFAYNEFNRQHGQHGLRIRVPQSVINVSQGDVPRQVAKMGGRAIVKIPYSNAGQGVFPITNPGELSDFMSRQLPYERLIVQHLIGAQEWTSGMAQAGTVPDERGDVYSADLRLMVGATAEGFRTVAAYARRAHVPLPKKLANDGPSTNFLLTNLSYLEDGDWKSDKQRVLVLDRQNMDRLGWHWPDLANAFIQTCLAMIAIDELACRLMDLPDRELLDALRGISDDSRFLNEIADLNRFSRQIAQA